MGVRREVCGVSKGVGGSSRTTRQHRPCMPNPTLPRRLRTPQDYNATQHNSDTHTRRWTQHSKQTHSKRPPHLRPCCVQPPGSRHQVQGWPHVFVLDHDVGLMWRGVVVADVWCVGCLFRCVNGVLIVLVCARRLSAGGSIAMYSNVTRQHALLNTKQP